MPSDSWSTTRRSSARASHSPSRRDRSSATASRFSGSAPPSRCNHRTALPMTLRHHPRPALPAAHGAAPARRIRGGTLIGVFIGVVVGLAIAAGVAFYLMRGGNPYQSTTAAKDRDVTSARNSKGEPGKPRFDFYKILPGGEEPKATARVPGGVEKAPAERPLTSPDRAGGP